LGRSGACLGFVCVCAEADRAPLETRRQEADDRKLKAIQAALRREFAAPSTDAGGDSNPLTRRNKLSATNPLLGDDDND
jgi:hypothetical protein